MPLLPILHQKQRYQTECLAACAAMILNYLQKPIDYDKIVKFLDIGPAGAPFRNLNHLKRLGLLVLIEQGQIDTIRQCIEQGLPPIVFVSTQELSYWDEITSHAVVVAGIDNQSIYLNDPCFDDAPQIIPIDEFDLAWLGMDEFYALIRK